MVEAGNLAKTTCDSNSEEFDKPKFGDTISMRQISMAYKTDL